MDISCVTLNACVVACTARRTTGPFLCVYWHTPPIPGQDADTDTHSGSSTDTDTESSSDTDTDNDTSPNITTRGAMFVVELMCVVWLGTGV